MNLFNVSPMLRSILSAIDLAWLGISSQRDQWGMDRSLFTFILAMLDAIVDQLTNTYAEIEKNCATTLERFDTSTNTSLSSDFVSIDHLPQIGILLERAMEVTAHLRHLLYPPKLDTSDACEMVSEICNQLLDFEAEVQIT